LQNPPQSRWSRETRRGSAKWLVKLPIAVDAPTFVADAAGTYQLTGCGA